MFVNRKDTKYVQNPPYRMWGSPFSVRGFEGTVRYSYTRTSIKILRVGMSSFLNSLEEWQPLVVNRAAWKAAISSEKFLGRRCSSKNRPQPQPPSPAVPPRSPRLQPRLQSKSNKSNSTCESRRTWYLYHTCQGFRCSHDSFKPLFSRGLAELYRAR